MIVCIFNFSMFKKDINAAIIFIKINVRVKFNLIKYLFWKLTKPYPFSGPDAGSGYSSDSRIIIDWQLSLEEAAGALKLRITLGRSAAFVMLFSPPWLQERMCTLAFLPRYYILRQ